MTASEVSTSCGGSLLERTPVRYTPGSAAGDLATLIDSPGDARRVLRLAYGHVRGIVTATTVADRDFEDAFQGLRARIKDFARSGGLRRLARLDDMVDASSKLTIVALCIAALFHACQWRLEELAPAATNGGTGSGKAA